jgi:uncharacterized membrane protein
MLKWIIAYVAAAVAFGVLDAIWLRWAAGNLYRPVIGEIMAKDFNVAAAGAFYVIYVAGMTWFAIKPGIEAGAVQLRGTLDRRPGYAGAVHPGWTRYLVAVGARVG